MQPLPHMYHPPSQMATDLTHKRSPMLRFLTILSLTLTTTACQQDIPSQPTPTLSAPTAPQGFSQAYVEQISYTAAGPAILIRDTQQARLLSIFIAETEAQSLQLRKERRRFVRPLTHDLLDEVINKLGGEVYKVHIDGYKDQVFTSTLFLHHQGRLHQLDARPSDAVTIAVGRRVPIYVKDSVFTDGGFTQKALNEHKKGIRATPFSPPGQVPPKTKPL